MTVGPLAPKPLQPRTVAKTADQKPVATPAAAAPQARAAAAPQAAPAPKRDVFETPGTGGRRVGERAPSANPALARLLQQTASTPLKPSAPQVSATVAKGAAAKTLSADVKAAVAKTPSSPTLTAHELARSLASALSAAKSGPAAKSDSSAKSPSSAKSDLLASSLRSGAKSTGGSTPSSTSSKAPPSAGRGAAMLNAQLDAVLAQAAKGLQAARAAKAEKAAEAAAAEVASPQGPPKQQTVSGEDRARQEVEVKTVPKKRDETLDAQKKLGEETNARADHLFSLADSQGLPPGLTVTRNGNEAVLERKNAQGELLERTVATKGDNGAASLDTASYKDGTVAHDHVEIGNDGSSRVQRASYKSDTNDVAAPKSFDDLGSSRDAGVTYTDNQVHTDNGQLHIDAYQQAGDGGVTSSRTSFSTEQGLGHLDDKIKPLFPPDAESQTTDRCDNYTYSIPPPGADGSQGDPTFTHTASYSQGNAQATSVVQRDLDGHKQFAGTGNHTRADVESVRDEYGKNGGENYDADDGTKAGKTPKTWVAEYQKDDNTSQTQSFVEGSPDNTLVTTRTRDGNTINEDYQGKGLKPDATNDHDLADVSGHASRTYADDGSISAMESQRHDADGSDVHQKYTSERNPTSKGLELDEHQETQVTQDNQTSSSSQDTTSLLSDQGAQLTSAHSEVTDANGRKATHEVGAQGEKLSLTGPAGADPHDINTPGDLGNDPDGQALLSQASISTANTIQDYAGSGGAKALNVLQGLSDGADKLPGKASQVLGSGALNDGLKAARTGASALGGVAGAVAGGVQLADGIRQHNTPEIFKGLVDTASGAKNLYDAGVAGKDFIQSIRGISTASTEAAAAGTATAAGAADAGKWAGTAAAKVGGSVASSALEAVKGLGGIGNVAGAVLSTGLGINDIVQGVKNHDGGQIAKGAVGIAGGIGGAIAVAAVGGPLGIALGAGIGLLVWGIDKIIDRIQDKAHQISQLKIGPPPAPLEPSPEDIALAGVGF